jgi:hypothetical protein
VSNSYQFGTLFMLTAKWFIARIAKENLSISKSIVAYDEKKPVGILLNGIQEVNGVKIAWNGGTAVVLEYRNLKIKC